MMRVVQAFEPPGGGLPEHVSDLSIGLAERGHEVIAVGPPGAQVRGRMQAGGVGYLAVPVTGSLVDPRGDGRYARQLARVLRESRAQVLHVHGQKAGMLGRPVAGRLHVPAVYTPHSFVYRSQRLRPRRSAALRESATRRLEQYLGQRSAAVVTVAEEERGVALADGIADAAQLPLIRYGVTCDPAVPADPDLVAFGEGHQLFGMVAALREQKGIPTLLEALGELHDISDRVRFVIVGSGLLESQVRAAVDGELSDFVRWVPFAGPVERYLSALDVFVLPSYWEALPIAVLEAMCMGLPVIASAVNGTPEAVRDGVSGLLVPPSDPAALAAAIRTLSADRDRQAAMGEAGRRFVAETFGMQRMLDEHEALYRLATGEAGGDA